MAWQGRSRGGGTTKEVEVDHSHIHANGLTHVLISISPHVFFCDWRSSVVPLDVVEVMGREGEGRGEKGERRGGNGREGKGRGGKGQCQ